MLLTFTRSQVVEAAILAAHAKGLDFRVIIVDGAPRYEGRVTLDPLLAAGVRCTYAHLHALSYLMPEVTKVLLGAASMLLNGTLVSRAGSALVAMSASERGIPVLVCCETYKFAERVLLDSICYNELGDPDDLIEPEPHPPLPAAGRRITDWRDIPQLKLLNLLYDVTPTKYLSVVVTEVSALLSLTAPSYPPARIAPFAAGWHHPAHVCTRRHPRGRGAGSAPCTRLSEVRGDARARHHTRRRRLAPVGHALGIGHARAPPASSQY